MTLAVERACCSCYLNIKLGVVRILYISLNYRDPILDRMYLGIPFMRLRPFKLFRSASFPLIAIRRAVTRCVLSISAHQSTTPRTTIGVDLEHVGRAN